MNIQEAINFATQLPSIAFIDVVNGQNTVGYKVLARLLHIKAFIERNQKPLFKKGK